MKLPLAEMEKILGGAGVWEEIGISVGLEGDAELVLRWCHSGSHQDD